MDGTGSMGAAELDAFIASNLVSFPAWDLLVYLHRNPEADVCLADLCTDLTRSAAEIAPALARLTETGMLDRRGEGEDARYRLTTDASLRAGLAGFVDAAQDRGARLEFVRHVMGHLWL